MDEVSGFPLKNQEGSAVVMALLALVVLTIIGVASMNTNVIENQIVRNEKIYQDNFYRAESSAMQGLQMLNTAEPDELKNRDFDTFAWLKQHDQELDMGDASKWTEDNSAEGVFPDSKFAVAEEGIASGASIDMTATTNVYDYVARGYSESNTGRAMIEIGYKKRH